MHSTVQNFVILTITHLDMLNQNYFFKITLASLLTAHSVQHILTEVTAKNNNVYYFWQPKLD